MARVWLPPPGEEAVAAAALPPRKVVQAALGVVFPVEGGPAEPRGVEGFVAFLRPIFLALLAATVAGVVAFASITAVCVVVGPHGELTFLGVTRER